MSDSAINIVEYISNLQCDFNKFHGHKTGLTMVADEPLVTKLATLQYYVSCLSRLIFLAQVEYDTVEVMG